MVNPFEGLLQGYGAAQQIHMTPQLNQLNLMQERAKLEQLQGLDPLTQQKISESQTRESQITKEQEAEARNLIADLAYTHSQVSDDIKPVLMSALSKVGIELGDLTPEEFQSMSALGLERRKGSLGTEARNFEQLTKNLSDEDKELARRIKLGLDPRAVGSAAITIAETGKTEDVATSEAAIAGAKEGAKETAKLTSQFDLKPEVEGAVKSAVSEATASAEIASKNRSNASALRVYETAMRGLNEALGGAYTGPLMGLVPAMTTNQQIAQGAVAAMAPVLKQLFRTASEGSFTDKDQELLLDMVPTRKDTPEARAAKINNINAIVMAKLGQQSQETTKPLQDSQTSGQGKRQARKSQYREGQTATGPGGKKLIYKDGQWVDL